LAVICSLIAQPIPIRDAVSRTRPYGQSSNNQRVINTSSFNSFTAFFKSAGYLRCYGLIVPSQLPAGLKSKGNKQVNINITK
jgi:hypothetical protein